MAALFFAFFAGWQKAKFDHSKTPPKSWFGSSESYDVFPVDASRVSVGDFVDVQMQDANGKWVTIAFCAQFKALARSVADLQIQQVDLAVLEALIDDPTRLRPTVYPGYTTMCEDCVKLERHDALVEIGYFSNVSNKVLPMAPLHHACVKCRSTLVYLPEPGWLTVDQLDEFVKRKVLQVASKEQAGAGQ